MHFIFFKIHHVKAKTAFNEFTLLVVYLLRLNYHKSPLTENTNKALMVMGRNLRLNHIKRHFKSVYFIKYKNSIFRSRLFYDPLMFL